MEKEKKDKRRLVGQDKGSRVPPNKEGRNAAIGSRVERAVNEYYDDLLARLLTENPEFMP